MFVWFICETYKITTLRLKIKCKQLRLTLYVFFKSYVYMNFIDSKTRIKVNFDFLHFVTPTIEFFGWDSFRSSWIDFGNNSSSKTGVNKSLISLIIDLSPKTTIIYN